MLGHRTILHMIYTIHYCLSIADSASEPCYAFWFLVSQKQAFEIRIDMTFTI